MAEMTPAEPQSASDYDDRTTAAVKTVLIEIGQILGSFKGKFAVVGGAVPWLLLGNEDMPHVGTLDVDLGWTRKRWVTANTPRSSMPYRVMATNKIQSFAGFSSFARCRPKTLAPRLT